MILLTFCSRKDDNNVIGSDLEVNCEAVSVKSSLEEDPERKCFKIKANYRIVVVVIKVVMREVI